MKKVFYLMVLLAMVFTACAPKPAAPTEAAPAANTQAPVANTQAPAAGEAVKELTILWAQWSPADYLQQIGAMYEKETGIKVTVVQEPWGSFGDRFNVAMAASGTEWDMVVGDSQWIGQGATAGYY